MEENHVCEADFHCTCYQLADEPKESCNIHGFGVPRCRCGRFVKGHYYYEPKEKKAVPERVRLPDLQP